MPEALLVGAAVDDEEELDDDVDRSDVDELVSALDAEVEALAVVLSSSSFPRSRNSATPTAARMTTPATIRAISVFLLPFGG